MLAGQHGHPMEGASADGRCGEADARTSYAAGLREADGKDSSRRDEASTSVTVTVSQPPTPGADRSALSARFSAEVGDRGLVRSPGSCRVICRWTLRLTPLLIDAAPHNRRISGDRWYVDGTSAKVAGRYVYPYRMIDQYGGHRPIRFYHRRHILARWLPVSHRPSRRYA